MTKRYHHSNLSRFGVFISEDENTNRVEYLKHIYQLIKEKKKEKENIKILDIGCGSGLWTHQLKENIPNAIITGIDISETQIQLAKKDQKEKKHDDNDGGDIQYICQDIMMANYPSNHFDVIIGLFSIIHLSQEDQSNLFPKLYQWLDPQDGILCMNLSPHLDPCIVDQNWLGAKMFWSSLGESTYKQLFMNQLHLNILKWDIVDEKEDDKLIPFLWLICEKN
ncbi:unnamed protein product [Cunninghamella blakesleeana]